MSCPFHPDRTPSAAINFDREVFWCGSCGRSGSAVKLVHDELHLDWREAYKRLELAGFASEKSHTGKGKPGQPVKRRKVSDIL